MKKINSIISSAGLASGLLLLGCSRPSPEQLESIENTTSDPALLDTEIAVPLLVPDPEWVKANVTANGPVDGIVMMAGIFGCNGAGIEIRQGESTSLVFTIPAGEIDDTTALILGEMANDVRNVLSVQNPEEFEVAAERVTSSAKHFELNPDKCSPANDETLRSLGEIFNVPLVYETA